MTAPIVRMYETNKQARDAVGKLRKEGFSSDDIFLMTPASKGYADTVEPLSIAIKAGFVPGRLASACAAGLQEGRSLVSIAAPFGYGLLATKILDGCDPVATGFESRPGYSVAWDEGAPLSSALLLPTVWRNMPAPFSTLFSFKALRRGRTFASPKCKELASPDYALFGKPRLSDNPAPLSSIFNLKTISVSRGAPWTRSFGLPMLSQNAAPFSSALGLELLTGWLGRDHPAPFSAVVGGIPTLSRGRSLLSRMFPALASPRFALFGRNPLIDNPAPLSSLLGKGTLTETPQYWEKSFGWPLLEPGAAPTCAKLGIPMLSRNPAPLSSLLGLPVLSMFQ